MVIGWSSSRHRDRGKSARQVTERHAGHDASRAPPFGPYATASLGETVAGFFITFSPRSDSVTDGAYVR